METTLVTTENVPEAVLLSILQQHLGDPNAQLKKATVSPFSNSGVSGNNSFYRADIEWATTNPMLPAGSANWLIKRWIPGGLNLAELHWSRPAEALAWQSGILRPESLPTGVKTPILGSVIDPGGELAWVAMQNVSKELMQYDRAVPLPSEQLVSRVKVILSHLARFHAIWEQPARQNTFDTMDWLLPYENYLWRRSDFYAAVLSIDAGGESGQTAPVSQEDARNLQAFLEWLEPAERSILKELLVDRQRLVDRFAGLPCTLLHGDLDDRNIGLSWPSSGESVLVLIDWERMSRGPASLDVAKMMILVPMLCLPGQPIPEACLSDELLDFYYENYTRAGGKQLDYATWHRSYDLALIAESVWPFPWALGNLLRTLRGEVPLPEIPGLPEAVVHLQASSSLERMRRMVDLVMGAINRCLL